MKPLRYHLPLILTGLLAGAALWYGPIVQFPDYHNLADRQTLWGIPHAADVLSNLGFAIVALWGWSQLAPASRLDELAHSWPGYRLFLIGIFLTSFGSAYYHFAPDNAALVWDRLPIALACGGLLAGVRGDARQRHCGALSGWLALAGIASVAWWNFTGQSGAGDLRPYLLLQLLPILLIPLWQWLYEAPKPERWTFGVALLIYVLGKIAELKDHEIAAALGVLTGHTLKHLLSTAAVALIVASLVRRVRTPASQTTETTVNRELPGAFTAPAVSSGK